MSTGTCHDDVECSNRILPKHLKRFRKACSELNAVMRRIQEYEPDANYYLQEDRLLLLVGPSHDDYRDGSPLRENEVDGVRLVGSSGGAW